MAVASLLNASPQDTEADAEQTTGLSHGARAGIALLALFALLLLGLSISAAVLCALGRLSLRMQPDFAHSNLCAADLSRLERQLLQVRPLPQLEARASCRYASLHCALQILYLGPAHLAAAHRFVLEEHRQALGRLGDLFVRLPNGGRVVPRNAYFEDVPGTRHPFNYALLELQGECGKLECDF